MSSPEAFWKHLIRTLSFRSCYWVTCLRVEVHSLWFISTLQKNFYFFPMENNSFVLCASVTDAASSVLDFSASYFLYPWGFLQRFPNEKVWAGLSLVSLLVPHCACGRSAAGVGHGLGGEPQTLHTAAGLWEKGKKYSKSSRKGQNQTIFQWNDELARNFNTQM